MTILTGSSSAAGSAWNAGHIHDTLQAALAGCRVFQRNAGCVQDIHGAGGYRPILVTHPHGEASAHCPVSPATCGRRRGRSW